MPTPPAPAPPPTAAPQATGPAEPLLSVLGPMSVRHGGSTLPLGPQRQRALLALLLIRLGRVVPTELLVEELWGENPPRQAVAGLQSHLSRLRRVLDPLAGPGRSPVLRHRAHGYVLELDPEHVDVCRFERLVTDGRRLQERGDPAAALDRLASALALWQGTPYAEFDNHPTLYDESTRLEQVRLTALESRAEAGLALGGAAEVAADLDAEVRRHPARERLVGHLMTALSRLGRQAEALEVYERTRGHLSEKFGVDTTAELRRIRTAILRQEPEAGGPTAAPHPGHRQPAGPAVTTGTDDDAARRAGAAGASGGAGEAGLRPGRSGRSRECAGAEQAAEDDVTATSGPAARPAVSSPFTGRSRELHGLTTTAACALAGHGHVAGILGPAGVGKTRLLLELAARLEDTAAGPDSTSLEMVWGHSFPGESVPPYWLWTQVLRRLSTTRPDDFRRAAEPFGALLAPLLPERSAVPGAGAVPETDWGRARFLRHDAVCEVLLALAGRHPLLLLLEDLHWADADSLELLRLLSVRRQSHPLGIVLTARDFEVDADPALRRTLSEILRGPGSETLRLGGLSRQAVAALVEAQTGPGAHPEVIDVLHRRSQGNPYFVMQLLSLFGDARGLHRPDAVEVLLTRVPTGVRETLHQRFATLPESVLRVLQRCAVIGTEIDTDLLHSTAAAGEGVATAVETAIAAGLLGEDPQRPGRLHFTHALVQETLTDGLAREERQRLHATVAAALCDARGHAGAGDEETERVAHHTWHAMGAVPSRQALPRLLRAAEHAEQHWAYERVETWLRRALHRVALLPCDDPSTVRLEQRLHIQLGQVLATTRGYGHPEAESHLARGRNLSAATRAPEDPSVLWALCAAFLVTGRYDASRTFSGLLWEIAHRTGDPVAVLGAAYGEGIVLHVRGRLPQALAQLEHGVAMADRFAGEGHSLARTFQHDPRVSCRSYDAFTHWLLGDQQTAGKRRQELLHLTAFESRPSDRSFALYVDAVLAAWEGDAATARAAGAEGARLAGEHGLRYWKAMLGLLEGWGLAFSGREDDGLSLMQASLGELGDCKTYLRHPLHLGLLGQAQHHAGRVEDARATFRTLLAAVEQRRERVYLHEALPTAPLLHDLLGSSAVEAVRAG
ncbi:BTAD domain-containing putative transcriptional regulator [Streptomyces cinnamoneus]|uniref:OmpR/PhoB-type domain-containing protein n=1 Tax=Streptomyces cinnamoneus TaxID=53446 RepID=A0A918TCX4_STRCJ|nr:BTAD domain-containing putative transcriptional regulator [Streptomyces cinnamoneus]GHC43780.1 hypothetical protein GCM10010507_18270 [Streptomyces cinnamoneus]